MRRVGTLMSVTAFGFLAAGALFGDDQTPKLKGRLPPSWSKLGLSDDQKQDLYTLQSKYQTRRAELQKQLRALRKEEMAAMYKVLTPAQKARLKEILAEKAGSGTEPKEVEVTPPKKKPGDTRKP